MAHFPDALQCRVFLIGANALIVNGVAVAVDELDRLDPPAGRFALPDLSEATAAQGFNEAISGNRLRVRLAYPSHVAPRNWTCRCFGVVSGSAYSLRTEICSLRKMLNEGDAGARKRHCRMYRGSSILSLFREKNAQA